MRIGLMSGATPDQGGLDGLVAEAKDLESRGFASMWLANIFGFDAITTAAIIGRETERIDLGTAVVPTYPRHPAAIAQQALTTQSACAGRFTLGIGLSHQIVIEDMFGLSYARRAKHMREYLAVLGPLLRGEPVEFEGEEYKVKMALDVPNASETPVLVAALGDQMLNIAGQSSAGTILWMTGPATIDTHIRLKLTAAANKADRSDPRIVAGLPIALTNDADAAREKVGKMFSIYGQLPSYRAMLDKEGVEGPAEVALLGDEKSLDASIDRLRDAGVTELMASIAPIDRDATARTLDYLSSRL